MGLFVLGVFVVLLGFSICGDVGGVFKEEFCGVFGLVFDGIGGVLFVGLVGVEGIGEFVVGFF